MKKKDDTLRAALLSYARKVADAKGIDAINIRSIAKEAGVAAGTIYNYFSNKDEILLALMEEYWQQMLLKIKAVINADCFCDQLEEIFAFLREQIDHSAGKLMNSLNNVEAAGQNHMIAMQAIFSESLIRLMEQDKNVRKDIWNEAFTKEQYARFIMVNMTFLLRMKAPDLHFFIAIVKRTIY